MMGGKKEIYRDVRFFHRALHLFSSPLTLRPQNFTFKSCVQKAKSLSCLPWWTEKRKVVNLYCISTRSVFKALRYDACSQGISQFYLHTHTFIRNRNEPYLPLPSQPKLVLIYRPRRDARLSRPWCEVAPGRDLNLQPFALSVLTAIFQVNLS